MLPVHILVFTFQEIIEKYRENQMFELLALYSF